MLKKLILKILCMLLTLSMISSLAIVSFADEEESLEPTTTPINISANYFSNETENSYKIIFSSLDVLDNLKDFNFAISFSNATIQSVDLTDEMETGGFSTSQSNGNKTFTLLKGSEETPLSGKLTLCILTVLTDGTALSAENISITDFTAKSETDEVITFAPTLNIEAGPVVPELSDKEQAVYDSIVALPDKATLSFYKEEQLIPFEELGKEILTVSESYNTLTEAEKTNINENLEYNLKNISSLTELVALIDDMKAVYDIVMLNDIIKGIDEPELTKYAFVTDIYNQVKEEISAPEFPAESTVLTQYTTAKENLDAKSTVIATAYTGLDYDGKYSTLNTEFPVIQNYSANKYHSEFIVSILDRAKTLLSDTEESFDGPDYQKNALLEQIETLITKIEMVKNGFSNLPTFEIGDIRRGSSYDVTLTREASAASQATVRFLIYSEDDLENTIHDKTFEFASGETTLEDSIMASSVVYPYEKSVVIKVYYSISGAEVLLGSVTRECKTIQTPSSRPSGIPTSPSNTTNKEDSNISGGTKFPSGSDDEDEKIDEKPAPAPEKKLFNDIDTYDWAIDAIEGLYYVGIVNGMEEGVFNPAGQVTREQFCKMVVQLFGVMQYDTETNFVDVNSDAWYASYINSAIKAGYVQGQSDEYFGIGEPIMRQDMATILYRGLGSKNKAIELDFTDNENIAPYAQDAISELCGLGVFNGYEDGSFKPRGTATRAEAAKVIWGIYQILNDK